MDRNHTTAARGSITHVALRKESVDRNKSLGYISDAGLVALRKESVDRNSYRINGKVLFEDVALRKESVDRNAVAHLEAVKVVGRSPQGERG